MASSNFQRRMEVQRERDDMRSALRRDLVEDTRLSQVNAWQARGDEVKARRLLKLNKFMDMKRQLKERRLAESKENEEAESQRIMKQEEARKLAEENRANEMRKRIIIENNPQLRELKSKLNLVYIRKERAQQLESKAASELLRKQSETELDEFLESQPHFFREENSQVNLKLLEQQKDALRKSLLEQINFKAEQTRKQQLDEVTTDMRSLEAIIKEIEQDERNKYLLKIKQQEKTRNEISESENMWRKAKQENEAMIKMEQAKIAAYQLDLDSREKQKVTDRANKLKEQEKLAQIIQKQHESRTKEEEALYHAREVISIHEKEEEMRQKDKAKQEIKLRQRKELQDAFEETKKLKTEQKLLVAQDRVKYREQLQKKYEQDEIREKAIISKLLSQKQELRNGLDSQMKERYQKYELEKAEQEKELKKIAERELYEEQILKEARKRLIEENKAVIEKYGADLTL